MNVPERFSELWNDYLEGELSAEGQTELRALFATDPSLEKLAVDLYQLHRSLGYAATSDISAEAFVADTLKRVSLSKTGFVPRVLERLNADAVNVRPRPTPRSWFNSIIRPLAAGLVLGGLSVGMVWAYAAPVATARVLSLLELGGSDFGARMGEIKRGFPVQVGVWGGDPADFIEPKKIQGVQDKAASKNKIWLRFERTGADQVGMQANSSDVFQIIDLRNVLETDQGLDTTIELSARFADRSPQDAPKTTVGCQIYFFRTLPENFARDWPNEVKSAAAFTGNHVPIPRSTSDFLWTPVSVKATPPPDVQFAVIQLSAIMKSDRPFEEKTLGNHFVDSVSLIIKTQPALPSQLAKKL